MWQPELSSLEAPNGLRGYTTPICVPMPVIRKFKTLTRFISGGRCPIKEAPAHRKMEDGSNPEVPSGRRHSVLLSGLFDTKLFQSFEYPVCKQFMRKTIGVWIGRRHPQLR